MKAGTPPEDNRLVWNGSTKFEPDNIVMNDIVPLHNEAPITLGFVFVAFVVWIWNTCVSYPSSEIYVASTDIKACHRYSRIFPEFAPAFGFIIIDLYSFISTATTSTPSTCAPIPSGVIWRLSTGFSGHEVSLNPSISLTKTTLQHACSSSSGSGKTSLHAVPT